MSTNAPPVSSTKNTWPKIRIRTLCIEMLVGILYILLNFPNLLHQGIHHPDTNITMLASMTDGIQQFIDSRMVLLETVSSFQLAPMIRLLFIEMVIYITLGLIVALRTIIRPISLISHNGYQPWKAYLVVGPMVTGLLAGFIGLHVVAWLLVLLLNIGVFLFRVVAAFGTLLSAAFGTIGRFLLSLGTFIWDIFGWWLVLAFLVLLITILLRRKIAIPQLPLFKILGIGSVILILWLLYEYILFGIQKIISFFTLTILPFIGTIVAFIVMVVFFLLKIVGVCWLLSFLGRLFIDQFRAPATSCDGPKGVFMGAFGIGSMMTLIFLGTVFNPVHAQSLDQGWLFMWQSMLGWLLDLDQFFIAHLSVSTLYCSLMPEWLYAFGLHWLSQRSLPLFDMMAANVILFLTCLTFCIQLLRKEVTIDRSLDLFYNFAVIQTIGLYFVAILLLFFQGLDDHS